MNFTDARKYKKQIKNLYTTAFPRNERAPLWFLYHRTANGRDSFNAVMDGDQFVGLVYTIRIKKLVYVFFLAVVDELRGRGYGSAILQRVKDLYPDCTITLAIEDTADKSADNYEQRLKRLKFYQSNGFKQLHFRINEAGVVYELLGTKNTVSQADFLAMMKNYFGNFLYRYIYRKTELDGSVADE